MRMVSGLEAGAEGRGNNLPRGGVRCPSSDFGLTSWLTCALDPWCEQEGFWGEDAPPALGLLVLVAIHCSSPDLPSPMNEHMG